MSRIRDIIGTLSEAAAAPADYAARWKNGHGGPVIGILPMNFPVELIHAAGALPMLVQESMEPITLGRSLIFEFYCGYTRSLVDQAVTGQLSILDALFLVDHCVALLGAADAIRYALPELPVYLSQFPAGMDEALTSGQVNSKIALLRDRLVDFTGAEISDQDILASIRLYNENRTHLREIYDLRREGRLTLAASDVQIIVKSSMIMDIAEHTALLGELVDELRRSRSTPSGVRLHLSGHFCHAPQPELLDMIEACGATIADDDLFTGYRYIATDVPEAGEPLEALTQWYFQRNNNVPCSTRAQKSVDWDRYLLDALASSESQGVIILMPKFCEPHMLYYPELRKAFEASGIPHLLIETEHEGLALESVRVRVEAFVETMKRRAAHAPALV